MSSIDNRIVQMQFKNKNFQKGISDTLSSLDKLKKNLNFSGATKGLQAIEGASRGVTMSAMGAAVDGVKVKFGALQVAAVAALGTIVNKAVNAGVQLGNALFLDSKKAGFDEYELKMGSIQTIMAGTGEDLEVVNKRLDDLNTYADKTIYSFSDMTDSIGKFTNAGVDLDTSVDAIQGISNAAALAGASSNDASRAMYNFSQSLSQGSVRLQDWMSIENANMATAGFREELIKSAEAAGTLTKAGDGLWKTMEGNEVTVKDFRNTLADGWLNDEALLDGLSKYADGTTDLGKAAFAAAQDIKTGTQLIDTWKEAAGSGWAQSFEIMVGDFEEAKQLWTGINNAIEPILAGSADRRNAMLEEWKELGGRTAIIEGVKNVWESLGNVIKPVKEAFSDIFPKSEANWLNVVSQGFLKLTETFKIGAGFGERLKTTFKGIFSVLKIVVGAFKSAGEFLMGFAAPLAGIGRGLFAMASAVGIVVGRFAEWAASTGFVQEFFRILGTARDTIIVPLAKAFELVGIAFEALAKGNTDVFFDRIGRAGEIAMEVFYGINETLGDFVGTLGDWAGKISGFFAGIGTGAFGGVATALEWVSDALSSLGSAFDAGGVKNVAEGLNPLESAGETLMKIWGGVKDFFAGAREFFAPLVDVLDDVGGRMADYIKNFDMTDAVALFNAGMIAGILFTAKKVIDNIKGFTTDFKGIWDSIKETWGSVKETFDQLTSTLETMQTSIRASIILKIAAAVGILAISLKLLSTIPKEDLWPALAAIGGLLAGVTLVMKVMSDMEFGEDTKLVTTAIYLVGLAIAVNILASALEKISGLSWEEIGKGLVAVGAILGGLILFTKFAQAESGGIAQGVGLILLAAAIHILAGAVEKFGKMDVQTLLKGVGTITALFLGLSLMVKVMNGAKGMVAASVGLLILSASLYALYWAMKPFIGMDYAEFAKGLGLMAGMLTAIGLAMRAMPKGMIVSAAALIVVAGALVILLGVMKIFAGMDGGDIAKSLGMMAGALAIVAGAMLLMKGALPGAAALLVVAAALWVLVPVLAALKVIGWEGVGIFAALAAVLSLLGLAATAIAGPLAALGGALLLIAGALLLAGVGMLAFGTGFAAMAAVGAAGVAVLIATFEGVIALIPLFMEQIGLGLMAFAKVIAESGPAIVAALSTVLQSLLQAIIDNIPLAVEVMGTLIMSLVYKITEMVPQIANAALTMILRFLQVLRDKVPQITGVAIDIMIGFMEEITTKIPQLAQTATDMIVAWLNSIEEQLPRIMIAASSLIRKFIDEMAKTIENLTPWIVGRAIDMGGNIVQGVADEIWASAGKIKDALLGILGDAWDAALGFLGIRSPSRLFMWMGEMMIAGGKKGMDDNGDTMVKSATNVGRKTVAAMQKALTQLEVEKNMELRPTIAPVIDLTEARKGFKELGKLEKQPIKIDPREGRLRAIDTRKWLDFYRDQREAAPLPPSVPHEPRQVIFQQTNNSPKALSTAEIYRQTKNQLSTLKEEVA